MTWAFSIVSGTLPIEQTKLSTEITGPMSGSHSLAASGWLVRNRCCRKELGTQAATAPGDQQADDRDADDGGPLHDEDVADRGVAVAAEQPVAPAAAGGGAHVHRGVAFHRSGKALTSLLAGGGDETLADEDPERECHQHDHDRAAGELGQGELPAQQAPP